MWKLKTKTACCNWCIFRRYLLMSRWVKCAFRRVVMTEEMILAFRKVTAGSESSNSSFGSRPTLRMTSDILLSLLRTQRVKQRKHYYQSQSAPTDRKSNSQSRPSASLPDSAGHSLDYSCSTFLWYWWQAAADVDRAADKVCPQSWTRCSLFQYSMLCN